MKNESQDGRQRSILSIAVIVALFSLNVAGQVVPVVYADGFSSPVSIAHAGDERLFVVERSGTIRIINEQGSVASTPFLDISGIVKAGGEQGLLGLAFHPDYTENGYFFLNYTDVDGNTVIARFNVSAANPDLADPESQLKILSIEQPYINHNGGDLKFGPDGYLYIATGDGGASGDPMNNAQKLTSLLGKMLRIDIDNGTPYSIPIDNPYIENNEAEDEIWASGLRNPWRFSFDRETDDLWIADVGQTAIEELNFIPAGTGAGHNFGWRCYEGEEAYITDNCGAAGDYQFPLYQYYHSQDYSCSVTGGYVYRGVEYPSMDGYYFFSDYCNDILYSLNDSSGQWVLKRHGEYTGNRFSTFGEDMNGEIYIAGISSGTVYKLTSEDEQTGISKHDVSPWVIFPNPASDHIFVYPQRDGQRAEKVRIFTASGDLVKEVIITAQGGRMDLSGISPGVYVVEITTSGRTMYEKLILQRR